MTWCPICWSAAVFDRIVVDQTLEFGTSGKLADDALVGYGLDGPLREPARTVVDEVNAAPATVVSLDVLSGVDATTGEQFGAAVQSDHVVTLALPKTGLAAGPMQSPTPPSLTLLDIGIPAAVYERLAIDYRCPFDDADSVALTVANPS